MASAGVLLLAALAASTAVAKAPRPRPIALEAPAAGKHSLTAFSLTARKAPRLRVVGTVPSDLAVALGVARDGKHAGRYVGFVALLRRSARKTQAVRASDATFVVHVDPGGADVDGALSLREAILRADGPDDTIRFANTAIVNGPAGVTGGALLLDITSGSLTLTNSIVTGNTVQPAPAPAPAPAPSVLCTTTLVGQGTLFEVIGTTGCTGGTFDALQLVPLGGNRVVDQFPEQGQAQCSIQPSGSLICVFPTVVGGSGPIDVREQSAPNGFTIMRSTDGGRTWDPTSWSSTGP